MKKENLYATLNSILSIIIVTGGYALTKIIIKDSGFFYFLGMVAILIYLGIGKLECNDLFK